MKRFLLLSMLLCLQFIPAKAQFVTIPDANFATELSLLFPSAMNGNQLDTTFYQIVYATSIDVFGANISNLSGIQYFDNLKTLVCSDNQLTVLPPLPSTLEYLTCDYNQLTSLPTLPPTLIHLACSENQLTVLPQLPATLKNLYIDNNQFTQLPSLPNGLKMLGFDYNQISSLLSLPDSLNYLGCEGNLLTSLPALPSSFTWLICSYNQLTSLPAFPASLERLRCQFNQITSMPAVPDSMIEFAIYNNNIYCLTNLPHVDDSVYAQIVNNPFTCVPNQTNYSLGLPLCMDNDPINNPNNCIGVNIMGNIYTDLDSNCSFDSLDWPINNIPVKLFDAQNNMLAQSFTINGVYSFNTLLPDSYQVRIYDNLLPLNITCGQLNYQSVVLDSINQTVVGINFPVVCDTFDLLVQSVSQQGWVFPGQIHKLQTNIANNVTWYNLNCGSSLFSGNITIEVTGPVTYISPATNALTPIVSGNSFTYNISNFDSLTPYSFGLKLMVDTAAQANDQICVHVEIDPTPLDADPLNNTYDFCYNVVNSLDPNMKEVYPVNVLPGYDDWFTYTIHFQNTGNAPAFNIRLRDTLDANLDVNTFEIRGYSHAANTSISGNILTVRFNNIMLPDSTTDYEGSMGYFQYRIRPLPNLTNGTLIENTAYIYFDYNAPVVTNTTQNNFDITVGKLETIATKNEFVLFPNPSNGIFNFKDNKYIRQVEVYNLLGEQILAQGNQKQINLSGFAKGIYYARINGEVVVKLVKE